MCFTYLTGFIHLQAGADPNFDELFVEEAVRDKDHNTAFGRKPYPSALHCLIDTGVNFMEEVSDSCLQQPALLQALTWLWLSAAHF